MVLNKKIIIGVLIAVVLVLIIGWAVFQKEKVPFEKEVIPEKEETITEKQLRELEALKGEAPPLSEEENRRLLKELEELRK